jgi:alpha-tubulin suppressor-like RCC1 family protein
VRTIRFALVSNSEDTMQQVARLAPLQFALLFAVLILLAPTARAQQDMVLWGDGSFGQINMAPVGQGVVEVAGGDDHFVGLRADGRLISWGSDAFGQVSQTPTGNGFVAVSAGNHHSLALRGDGTIVCWGKDSLGQVSGAPGGSQWVAISGSQNNGLALSSTGQMYAWGDDGICNVSCMPTTGTYQSISAPNHAVRSDGVVVNWGNGANKQPVFSDFVQVASKGSIRVGLRSNGMLDAWGGNFYGIVSGLPAGNN